MRIVAPWQRLGPGCPPGTSRGAVSWWDGDSVSSSPLTPITAAPEEVPAQSQLPASRELSSSDPLLGASHGLWGASGTRREQGRQGRDPGRGVTTMAERLGAGGL